MAQVMRYHCFPKSVEPLTLPCKVNNVSTDLTMKGGVPTATLQQAMHPNFDAVYPVMLSICANYGFNGHEVVADGYGYSDSVLYTHLNMGWYGTDDVWYNLPKSGNPIWVSFENQNYDNDEMVCGNSWGNDIALEKATPATAEVPVTVAYSWIAQYYPAVPESGYPALVKISSANGRPVWQSYLLGLDPINAESEFRIESFEMKDGEPIIKWNVDDARLDSFGYECRIKGKADLTDLDWMEQLSGQRYFKAFVEPK